MDDQLGIFQILDRLEATTDNLLSRSVIFKEDQLGFLQIPDRLELQLTIYKAGQ